VSANAHDFTFPLLTGGELPLEELAGKPVLVVNTASECGFTPQYAELQRLWEEYGPRGLIVLGVPSNDFGAQEPGSATEIATFCERNYGVTFPLAAKQHVLGPESHPFYRWVTEVAGEDAAPRWNFHKYLIGRDGELVESWPSRVAPDSPQLRQAVEAALSSS
jgi:glutathione peroxidase